jgi:hypothetical protein
VNRTNPTFREHTLQDEENLAFIDELFDNLLDTQPVSSDTDKVPDLSL